MKKEVFLAIFIGFILGLIITFGIWTANKSLKQIPQIAEKVTPTLAPAPADTGVPSPTPISASAIPLSITSPEDEILSSVSSVTLTGVTSPKAVLTLSYSTGHQIITADNDGEFTAKIPLETGYNTLNITAFDSSGNSASKDLLVTYSTSKI